MMTSERASTTAAEQRFYWLLLVVSAGGIAASYLPKVLGQPWPVWWQTLIALFSYFTILSNFAVLLLSLGQLCFARARWAQALASMAGKTAIAVYLSITAIVYHLLLSRYRSLQGVDQLGDQLTHTITPALYVVFWLSFARGQPLSLQRVWLMLAFPLLFMLYWLVRGPIVGSYPYFFIDVNAYGYLRVLLHGLGLCLAFWLLGLVYWALSAYRPHSALAPVRSMDEQ